MSCPDAEDLAALLSGELVAGRRAEIIDHAASCPSCHMIVMELATTETVVLVDPQGATADDDAAPVRLLIANALREHASRTKIGRYHLLEIAGAGGMGVVWGAWDPELARRVALKLVHPTMEAARDRILAEGQALAKLSHPNVVPIYDVGIIDDRVYLVMEWIQGTTLRAYAATSCSQRDLIDAYRQAGEGLAAAHRAGLIHRDFKPDNAIRGDDSRVRVVDFGLARGDDEHDAKLLAGTPRYMPPEQAAAAPLTPAADQYAFAFSLREALTRTVDGRSYESPSWLAGLLARGTARAPGDRFPSMEELLRAISRDPARVWRRRAIAFAGATAAVAAFVAGRAQSDAAPTCVGSATEIAQAWSPTARASLVSHLKGLGVFGADQADRLGAELNRYGATWTDEHRRACLAHERGELPNALYERRLGCLARGKASLTAVVELMTSVAVDGLPPALIAARSLPSAAGCAAADASSVPPPPEAAAPLVAAAIPAVERARVLAVASHADAIEAAKSSVAVAEKTGYAPLIARALVVQGRAEIALNAGEVATRTSLERALDEALRGSDDVLAVEAYARLVYAVSRYRGDVVENWSVMEAIAARTGPLGRFARALLYNNKGTARLAANDPAGARSFLQRALAASPNRQQGDDEIELINVLSNLALVAEDPAESEAKAKDVVDHYEATLGTSHPETLIARMKVATVTRNPVTAAPRWQAGCEGLERWHPQLKYRIVDCEYERGWLADDRGDTVTATAAMRIAADDPLSPKERDKGTIAAAYVKIITEGDTGTIAAMEKLALEYAKFNEFWNRVQGADAYITAATGWDRGKRPRDAERCWSAALELLDPLTQPFYARRLARVRATLAERWAATRPDEARKLAATALAWYRSAGGYDAEVAKLALIAARP